MIILTNVMHTCGAGTSGSAGVHKEPQTLYRFSLSNVCTHLKEYEGRREGKEYEKTSEKDIWM